MHKTIGKKTTKRQPQTSLKTQLEDINQKIFAKDGTLKRYRDKIKQYKQNRIFQSNEKKFYQQVSREYIKTNQQLDANETKQFWRKYGNGKTLQKC